VLVKNGRWFYLDTSSSEVAFLLFTFHLFLNLKFRYIGLWLGELDINIGSMVHCAALGIVERAFVQLCLYVYLSAELDRILLNYLFHLKTHVNTS
jgi:hypothetical protein